MKILIYNIGYCTRINGSTKDYITKFYRYLYTPYNIQKRVLQELEILINQEKLDIMSFIEIKENIQFQHIANKAHPIQDIENKYGRGNILRNFPILYKNRCNCIISTTQLEYRKHYLKYGTKKLLYEMHLPNNISLFIAHFSLNARVRKKQFREIKEFVKSKDVIITGDFNIFNGVEELKELLEDLDLEIRSNFKTYPSHNPKKELDIVICSKHIKLNSRAINSQISDHLPVIIDVEI